MNSTFVDCMRAACIYSSQHVHSSSGGTHARPRPLPCYSYLPYTHLVDLDRMQPCLHQIYEPSCQEPHPPLSNQLPLLRSSAKGHPLITSLSRHPSSATAPYDSFLTTSPPPFFSGFLSSPFLIRHSINCVGSDHGGSEWSERTTEKGGGGERRAGRK